MKSMFKPLLAHLRGRLTLPMRSNAAARPMSIDPHAVIDPAQVIERALRDAGLLRGASAVPSAHPGEQVVEGEFRVDETSKESGWTPANEASATSDESSFSAGQFAHGGNARAYKLFVPAGFAGQRLPLIVMLHGCTQDPDDFARGTRMNLLAQEIGAVVLYPAQAPRSNSSRCWNWFQPGDQRRESGEPALLAAMTRHIIATQAVDARQVHVAGLSAGGAMAAILGREYPDLFASIGVHSGLPPGAAHDVPSAFAAMKQARGGTGQMPQSPLIVFHGDRDQTVDPRNGEHVVGTEGVRSRSAGSCGRDYTRTLIHGPDGRVRAEHWVVHGAGHAWSGGSSAGSYADPLGPDASREMIRFFREHPHA